MTPAEGLALQAFEGVNYGMRRGARRFIHDMRAKPAEYELTPRQRWYLWQLAWTFRRQLGVEIESLALELGAGAPAPPLAVRDRGLRISARHKAEVPKTTGMPAAMPEGEQLPLCL